MNRNKKVILAIVIGVLLLVVGVNRAQVEREKYRAQIEEAALAAIKTGVKYDLFSWETIVAEVPKIAGYEVKEKASFRAYGTIPADSPLISFYSQEVEEIGMDVYGQSYTFIRTFAVEIGYYESEMALEEQLRIIPSAGYQLREENGVTIGFFERKELLDEGENHVLNMFVARQYCWVEFKVRTYFKGNKVDPFAGKTELESLISLAKERLLEHYSWVE